MQHQRWSLIVSPVTHAIVKRVSAACAALSLDMTRGRMPQAAAIENLAALLVSGIDPI